MKRSRIARAATRTLGLKMASRPFVLLKQKIFRSILEEHATVDRQRETFLALGAGFEGPIPPLLA